MDKIYLDHVSYIYGVGMPFERKALDDVCLGIRGGCITGIIGHTGSGKSTMMQLLNGLVKPTEGRVLLDGQDINASLKVALQEWAERPEYASLSRAATKRAIKIKWKKDRQELCFRVGLVMQYPEYQLFEETVSKDIAFGPRNMGLSEEEIRERVLEAAVFTDLPDEILEKSPFDLSGGQKRRVALAGVIAMRPDVLVLDEPAAGLDPIGRNHIFSGIREYQRKTGSTVLIVSHSMEDMARYSDDVVVMEQGKVVRCGSREEVFLHVDELAKTGLDIPQITRLSSLLRERGIPVPEGIYTVDDAVDALRALWKEGGAK